MGIFVFVKGVVESLEMYEVVGRWKLNGYVGYELVLLYEYCKGWKVLLLIEEGMDCGWIWSEFLEVFTFWTICIVSI